MEGLGENERMVYFKFGEPERVTPPIMQMENVSFGKYIFYTKKIQNTFYFLFFVNHFFIMNFNKLNKKFLIKPL